jgi:hypothetical protein
MVEVCPLDGAVQFPPLRPEPNPFSQDLRCNEVLLFSEPIFTAYPGLAQYSLK